MDQGSGAEIMYPDLYEGLGLTLEDLAPYNSPLVAFDGTIVMLVRQVMVLIWAVRRRSSFHLRPSSRRRASE